MENTNKTKKIFIVLACLLIAALIGFIIYQHQQIKKLSQGVNSENIADNESAGKKAPVQGDITQNSPTQNNIPATKEKGLSDSDDLGYQLNAAEEELDSANKQFSDEAAKKAENAENMMDLQKKMLQDPANQKMLRNTYRGQLDSLYGALYKELNLAPEKLDQLKELLTDQVMSTMDISLETLGMAPSEEKRKELQQRSEELKKENDAKISALLGDQDFKTYESHRDTLQERQIVSGFTESLGSGDKLTEAQQDMLIDSIYKERKNVYAQQGYAEEKVTFLSEINDEGIAKMMEMNDRTDDGYIKGAGATLSASQMEQFKAYLKQRRDMTESALKVSAQMFGRQTTQKSDEKNQE
jgi:hypothetical protein